MRAMIETEAENMHQKGLLTSREWTSIAAHIGHSVETARKYYVYKTDSSYVDCDKFMSTFNENNGDQSADNDNDSDSDNDDDDDDDVNEAIIPIQWGTKHPDYSKTAKRVQWSFDELLHLGIFCEKMAVKCPMVKNVSSRFKKEILSRRQELIPFYHLNHVITSCRFSHGYKRYKSLISMSDSTLGKKLKKAIEHAKAL